VRAHPVFGIGYGDWARPNWIPASVDNFWLLTAMRHGVPGLGFLAAAFILVLFSNSEEAESTADRIATAPGVDREHA